MKPEQLWPNMARLLERLVTAADRDKFLDECLDTLVEEFDAERGLILETHKDSLATVLTARGPNRDLTPVEREEISKTIIHRVQETGECVVWRAPNLDRTASMEALTITAALAAPLRAVAWRSPVSGDEDELRGVLYLDFRDMLKRIDDTEVELFKAAAYLVSIVLEMSQRIELMREDLRVAHAAAGGAAPLPSLDELLWPDSMKAIRREVEAALHGDSSILILGESGTGKTVLGRAIAEATARKPIVRAVLGASDDLNTITSELFGHERGAFSGAVAKRVGLVELAKGGTLILDEILNLPRHAQQLLLDFTQFGTYRPLGYEGPEPKRVKVRLIACTNGDLDAAIADGKFRMDLYYRLAAVVLKIPPLRARIAEIPSMVEAHLLGIDPARSWGLSVALRRLFLTPMDWAGNVRQLEAAVQRARQRALARDPRTTQLEVDDFQPADFGVASLRAAPLAEDAGAAAEAGADAGAGIAVRWKQLLQRREALDGEEKRVIQDAMAASGGVISRVARELGMPRSTLVSRMQALQIGS